MKISHFVRHRIVGPRGFSKWIQPNKQRYLLECCDCSLVHEFQFRVVGDAVQFSCRRANGYTKALRAAKLK